MWALRENNILLSRLLLLTVSTIVLIIIIIFIYGAYVGIDFTDEGYYLLMSAYPCEVKSSMTLYYVISSIFYQIFNNNLPLYRMFSFLLYFLVSLWFSYESIRFILNTQLNKRDFVVYSAIPLISGLFIFLLPVALTYNSLTNLSVMLTGALMIYSLRLNGKISKILLFYCIGIFVGSCLLLKFTMFFPLFILSFIFIYRFHREDIKTKYCFALGILTIVIIILLNENIISSFKYGLNSLKVMDSNHGMNLLILYVKQLFDLSIAVAFRLLLASPFFLGWYIYKRKCVLYLLGFLIGTFLPIVPELYGAERFLQISSICYFWLISILVHRLLAGYKFTVSLPFIWTLIYLVLPYLVSIGSNNKIYIQSLLFLTPTMIILSISLYLFNDAKIRNYMILIVISVIGFNVSYEQLIIPYRTADKIHNLIKFQSSHGSIYINNNVYVYLQQTKYILNKCNFKNGDNIIALYDLPGLVYALNGRSYSCPWYFGLRYHGANDLVDYCLGLYSGGLLERSYLILNNDVNFKEFYRVLAKHGASINNYKYCGSVKSTVVNGMSLSMKDIQIYAPINNAPHH